MDSPLGTAFSRVDALKRQLYDMLTNPRDAAAMLGGRIVESGQQAQALQEQTFGDPNRPFRVTDPQAMARLTDMLMAGPMGFAPAGMISPSIAAKVLPETKAVDQSGNPLMVYHGTADPIEKFSKSELGKTTGSQSAKEGFFFLDNPKYARNYADFAATDAKVKAILNKAEKAEKKGDWDTYDKLIQEAEQLEMSFKKDYGSGQNIFPAYLDMKNPFVFDAKGESYTYIEDSLTNIIKKAKKQGHDGVIFKNLDDVPGRVDAISDHYVVFEPGQIKSAISDPIFQSLLE